MTGLAAVAVAVERADGAGDWMNKQVAAPTSAVAYLLWDAERRAESERKTANSQPRPHGSRLLARPSTRQRATDAMPPVTWQNAVG
jgi:hypothetical protein